MERYELLKQKRKERDLSLSELSEMTGFSKSVLQRYETGATKKIPIDRIQIIAKALRIDPFELYDFEQASSVISGNINSSVVVLDDVKLYNAPLYENVSAGFGVTANNTIVGYIPVMICSMDEAEDTICIRVQGDSMSPKIEDGDIIQVRKQTSVDSGDIAVVLLDGSEGLVKKVEYDKEWIKLISLNMNYPPIVLNGKDVLRCAVLGKVKRVIRDI